MSLCDVLMPTNSNCSSSSSPSSNCLRFSCKIIKLFLFFNPFKTRSNNSFRSVYSKVIIYSCVTLIRTLFSFIKVRLLSKNHLQIYFKVAKALKFWIYRKPIKQLYYNIKCFIYSINKHLQKQWRTYLNQV